MATLEKRVQVLFEEEMYIDLQAEAAARRMSVGAFIREAVEERLERRRMTAEEALEKFFASGDRHPSGPINWEEEKDLMDEEILRRAP
jgi:hypothetical protein